MRCCRKGSQVKPTDRIINHTRSKYGRGFGQARAINLKRSGFLPMLAITMGFCLVFAFCAVRYGDDFWASVLRR